MNTGQVYGTGTAIPTPPPGTVSDPEERSFWGEVDKFKVKADEAYTLWQKLRAKRQTATTDPRLQAEYDDVMSDAENMSARASDVERIASQVREGAASTILDWFGLEGYEHAKGKVQQLGILPVLAIAAVSAAIAWVGSWLSKAYIVDRKLDAVESLVDKGVDARTAGGLVIEKGDPGPLSSFFGNLGTGVAVAGLAAVVLYFFFQKKKGF